MNLEDQTEASFASFGLCASIERGIADAGFVSPRPIQLTTIPAALQGRDILGLAQTGTGKTAAFALPMLERICRQGGPGPRALIMAPTRELAQQIDAELRLLARHTRVQSVTVYGGVSIRMQIEALRRRPAIIVACPGRLLDLLGSRSVTLQHIEMLVLDEADHMFDMGFLPDIRRILAQLPAQRQNMLFSATMPAEIRGLADSMLNDAKVVELAHSAPAETIEHAIFATTETDKPRLLQQLINSDELTSAIVFTRTKYRAKRLAEKLCQQGHRAVALQGNMSQNKRDEAMRGFRERRFDVLVATDIAARGIDVAKVSHVINYDVPTTPDAYTHRIGRTGRAELSGKAFTFAVPDDRALIRAIERQIGSAIVRLDQDGNVVPAEAYNERSAARNHRPAANGAGRSRGPRDNRPANGGGRPANGGGRPASGGARPQRSGSPGYGANRDGASAGYSRDAASPAPRRQRRRPAASNGPARDRGPVTSAS